jgi:hypothetical protein
LHTTKTKKKQKLGFSVVYLMSLIVQMTLI